MKWERIEQGRWMQVIEGHGPRMQIVWRRKRWAVQRMAWLPGFPHFIAPQLVGMFDSLPEAKAAAEQAFHGRPA